MMRDIRISIAMIVILLLSIGIVMIYSSSGIYAMQAEGDNLYFLKRHLLFLFFFMSLTAVVMTQDYRQLQRFSKPLLILCVVLLVLVLIPGIGKASYGARRWFRLGPFQFQPSELVKLAMLIYISDFLARKQNKMRSFFQGYLPVLGVLGVVSVLILKQPDLGSVMLIGMVGMIMMFVAGVPLRYLASLGALVLPVLALLIIKVPYRLKRVMVFLNPWEDSRGAGFQLIQSQIAFSSGGLLGVGLGKSVQKLFYLPAAHTDFILSIIGEELGLVGAAFVILLFVALIWQGARIAKRTLEPFGYFLSVGIVSMIGLQAMINVGVCIGALPTKGLTLPFISYGGSGLVFNLVAVGLLLNISRIQDV